MTLPDIPELCAFIFSTYHVCDREMIVPAAEFPAMIMQASRITDHFGEGPGTNTVPLSKDRNILGVIGEWGFEQLTGIPRDREKTTDHGWDFVLPDGRTVDAKATGWYRRDAKHWIHAHQQPLKADLYARFIVDLERRATRYCGYATAAEYVLHLSTKYKGSLEMTEDQLHRSLP